MTAVTAKKKLSKKYRREYYAENYSTGHAKNGSGPVIPADIVRLSEHTPCFFCGEAKGLCRHRTPW